MPAAMSGSRRTMFLFNVVIDHTLYTRSCATGTQARFTPNASISRLSKFDRIRLFTSDTGSCGSKVFVPVSSAGNTLVMTEVSAPELLRCLAVERAASALGG